MRVPWISSFALAPSFLNPFAGKHNLLCHHKKMSTRQRDQRDKIAKKQVCWNYLRRWSLDSNLPSSEHYHAILVLNLLWLLLEINDIFWLEQSLVNLVFWRKILSSCRAPVQFKTTSVWGFTKETKEVKEKPEVLEESLKFLVEFKTISGWEFTKIKTKTHAEEFTKDTKAVEDNLKEETEVLDITGEKKIKPLLLKVTQMKM